MSGPFRPMFPAQREREDTPPAMVAAGLVMRMLEAQPLV
jgi:hypothetical protein